VGLSSNARGGRSDRASRFDHSDGEIRAGSFEAAKRVCEQYERWSTERGHKRECESVIDWTIPPFELTVEEREVAERAVREALAKLPVGCGRFEMLRAKDSALAPFQARAEAIRTAERCLQHVRHYVEELGGDEGEWDLGDLFERQHLTEELKAKLRPALVKELQDEPLDEQAARQFIEEWIDEAIEGP